LITKDLVKDATFPVRVDATTDYDVGSGDGYVYNANANWTTCHDAITGSYATATGTNTLKSYVQEESGYAIARGFAPVDTSGIPNGANKSAATFYATVQYVVGDDDGGTYGYITVVQTSQASPTTLSTADFDQCGAVDNPTEGTDSRLDITSVSAGNEYNWPMNATGLGWISDTGWTYLGLRQLHDASDVAISGSNVYSGVNFYTSEQGGTDDPYLSVTYTVGVAPTGVFYGPLSGSLAGPV